jgi:hypothetical protein
MRRQSNFKTQTLVIKHKAKLLRSTSNTYGSRRSCIHAKRLNDAALKFELARIYGIVIVSFHVLICNSVIHERKYLLT